MLKRFQSVLRWAAEHERPLGAVLFAFGFLTDAFTFGILPVGVVNWFFIVYLGLAAVAALGTHVVSGFRERAKWWKNLLAVGLPLLLQYAVGGILSGFVVFYARNSVLAVSWPFILLLFIVYASNEYFRKHKDHLVFQMVLFFFTLYAYSVFAFPIYIDALGPFVFLGSTVIAVAVFGIFLLAMRALNEPRFKDGISRILWACGTIVLVVTASYFGGVIPPIPLTLADSGIYHSVRREGGNYVVSMEPARAWWDIRTPVFHAVPGFPVVAWSAVQAPSKFGTTVVHVWERYNAGTNEWKRVSRVTFPITGGRVGGYRGYTEITDVSAGEWRVTVETEGGQVIGRMRFDIEEAAVTPLLQDRTL